MIIISKFNYYLIHEPKGKSLIYFIDLSNDDKM